MNMNKSCFFLLLLLFAFFVACAPDSSDTPPTTDQQEQLNKESTQKDDAKKDSAEAETTPPAPKRAKTLKDGTLAVSRGEFYGKMYCKCQEADDVTACRERLNKTYKTLMDQFRKHEGQAEIFEKEYKKFANACK